WNVAQRFRFEPEELDEVRAEIHEHVRRRERTACSWEVGTHARPTGLVARLYERGLVDDEPTSLAIGMVLSEPPAAAPANVEVRRVETEDEFYDAERIAAVAFGGEPPTRRSYTPDANNVIYLAYADGLPVARASAAFGERGATLFGGSTLPE